MIEAYPELRPLLKATREGDLVKDSEAEPEPTQAEKALKIVEAADLLTGTYTHHSFLQSVWEQIMSESTQDEDLRSIEGNQMAVFADGSGLDSKDITYTKEEVDEWLAELAEASQ